MINILFVFILLLFYSAAKILISVDKRDDFLSNLGIKRGEIHPKLKNILSNEPDTEPNLGVRQGMLNYLQQNMYLDDKKSKIKVPIFVFDCDNLYFAFVSGLIKQRLYLSSALCDGLSDGELLSVIYHEKCHILNRDNIKLFWSRLLSNILFFLMPFNNKSSRERILESELLADRYAVSHLGTPIYLVSALNRIFKFNERRFSLNFGVSIFYDTMIKQRLENLKNME